MKVARERGDCEVRVGDQAIEQVDEMKYLRVMLVVMVGCRRKWRQELGVL